MRDQPLSILVLQTEDVSKILMPLSTLQDSFMLSWNFEVENLLLILEFSLHKLMTAL